MSNNRMNDPNNPRNNPDVPPRNSQVWYAIGFVFIAILLVALFMLFSPMETRTNTTGSVPATSPATTNTTPSQNTAPATTNTTNQSTSSY